MESFPSEDFALRRVEVLKQRGIWTGVRKICLHAGCPSARCRWRSHARDWRWELLHDPGERLTT